MYIRLGKINVNYAEAEYDDFLIFAEIVDSGMSFEKPVLVHNTSELNAWFGKNFTNYGYFQELLESNVTLFLYKPISTKKDSDDIGLKDYQEDPIIYESSALIENPQPGIIYNIQNTGKVVYLYQDFIPISDLPQSVQLNSESLSNRDTLRVLSDSRYTFPKLSRNGEILDISPAEKLVASKLEKVDLLDGVRDEKYTLAFSFTIDPDNMVNLQETSYYLVIGNHVFYTGPKVLWENDRLNLIMPDGKIIPKEIYGGIRENCHRISKYGEILNTLSGTLGFYVENDIIYCTKPTRITGFYNIPGITLDPLFDTSWNIITERYKGDAVLDLWSKTIGRDGTLEDDITIRIGKISDDYYQMTISRYDYEEVFEGSFYGNSTERLDNIVNRKSRLVGCQARDRKKDLPEGKWIMARGKKEVNSPEMFLNSLSYLVDRCSDVFPDFLMISDPSCYSFNYSLIRDYAEEVGMQVLVENNEDNVENNYLKDRSNWIIYFWESMNITNYQIHRPGYYLFLSGLLNDINSHTSTGILYNSPIDISSTNPYTEQVRRLERLKSNYLIDNGQQYYYGSYQNGENWISTVWMRFCLSKIRRELEKCRLRITGERKESYIRKEIESSLNKIQNNFSIIRSISIEEYFFDRGNSTLFLQISTSVGDLVNNDITIDLTLNLNN